MSHLVSGNELDNITDQVIPNFVQFLDHLGIAFIPCKLHSLVDDPERVHRDEVVELRGESVGVHALVVAGDRNTVNS